MNWRKGLVPAALLSLLVLGVFWTLRAPGPESVLRYFHIAAVNGDFRGMAAVSVQNANPATIVGFQREIASIAQVGGRYEVRKIVRKKGYAIAEVSYFVPFNRRNYPLLFIVEKHGRHWLINPDRSSDYMRQISGPPGESERS